MNIQHTVSPLFVAAAIACSIALSGCSKKEAEPKVTAEPAAKPATEPKAVAATPAAAGTTPVTTTAPSGAPAAPAADPMKSMMDTAAKQVDAAAAQAKQAMPQTAPGEAAAAPATPAAAEAKSLAMPQTGTTDNAMSSLTASTAVIQKQAEELLTRYSGELATLKSGAIAVKNYVDQHPDVLPEAAKAKYQQFNAMVPELDSLVATLKDYRNVDLTTLVPKLQNDFGRAKALYSEVRALLPENL